MASINLYIAEHNYLLRQGLIHIFEETDDIQVIGDTATGEHLVSDIHENNPDVLIINYSSKEFSYSDVIASIRSTPSARVIGITPECKPEQIRQLIKAGISGHLMCDCDHDEIVDSIRSVSKGEKFFCGKVLEQLNEQQGDNFTCEPVSISERELEILQYVAEGLTTKQIAEKIHLSFHTVMTHRKNMMTKLGINNTAGLIIYAVKENLISPNRYLFSQD